MKTQADQVPLKAGSGQAVGRRREAVARVRLF